SRRLTESAPPETAANQVSPDTGKPRLRHSVTKLRKKPFISTASILLAGLRASCPQCGGRMPPRQPPGRRRYVFSSFFKALRAFESASKTRAGDVPPIWPLLVRVF